MFVLCIYKQSLHGVIISYSCLIEYSAVGESVPCNSHLHGVFSDMEKCPSTMHICLMVFVEVSRVYKMGDAPAVFSLDFMQVGLNRVGCKCLCCSVLFNIYYLIYIIGQFCSI